MDKSNPKNKPRLDGLTLNVAMKIYKMFYYTSEEFFLYKITVDKRTIHHFCWQNELLTGT